MANLGQKSNFISNLSNFLSQGDTELLTELEVFIHNYKKEKQVAQIPVRLFSYNLAALETIVKYLHESGLSYAEISKMIHRDQRTIWVTYSKAIKKEKTPFMINKDDILVDINIFSSDMPPLKALVKHLIAKRYSIKQIASMLNRSYKNIWMIQHE